MSNTFKGRYDAVSALFDAIDEVMFEEAGLDTGHSVLLIHRKSNAYGYCYKKPNWPDAQGTADREVDISPTAFVSFDQLCTTMAHELVHCYNADNKVKDFAGRIHLMPFSDVCRRVGLKCEPDNDLGYITPCEHNPLFTRALDRLTAEQREVLNHLTGPYEPVKNAKEHPKMRWVCPKCGQMFAGKEDLLVTCAVCSVPFEYIEVKKE